MHPAVLSVCGYDVTALHGRQAAANFLLTMPLLDQPQTSLSLNGHPLRHLSGLIMFTQRTAALGPVAPLQQQLEHASQKAGFVDDKFKPRQQVSFPQLSLCQCCCLFCS